MTYDQLRAEEPETKPIFDHEGMRKAAKNLSEPLPAFVVQMIALRHLRRTGAIPCPSDHHWLQTPSTPKTCPTCGKEL